jgi:hypothetical protein
MTDNRNLVLKIQHFTVSSISLLNLLQVSCSKVDDSELAPKEKKAKERFMTTSQKFIDNMKDSDDTFEYTRFIKKAFNTLKSEEQCKQLVNKDPEIFNIRDDDNKIITIFPGIDIKFGYKFLNEDDKRIFWQYMYLFSSSIFNMIKDSNEQKLEKYVHIIETLKVLEAELSKTGVMFNNQIFNPFMGIEENSKQNYSLNEMFTGGELPKQQTVSIESVLKLLGVDKMFDEKKINEELKGIGDKEINEATDKIASLLGASDKPEVKEVCNMLIQDIVANFKENGITNLSDTLQKVAKNAKKNIELSKMKKTAESMKDFMAHSQDKMKDLKDANGNPIGQQLLNSMSIPMSMMNMLGKTKLNEEDENK